MICYCGLRLFSDKEIAYSVPSDAEIFPQLGLPTTVAERYELLKNDPNGELAEKVVQAARLKIVPAYELFTTRWLRTAGVSDRSGLETWRKLVKTSLLVSLAAVVIVGILGGVKLAATLAPFLFAAAVLFVIDNLRRVAEQRERVVLAALRGIITELRAALVGANDVITCLIGLTSPTQLAISPDPVRMALSQAVERIRAGQDLNVALKSAARSVEVRQFGALCSYLIALSSGSSEWKRQLDELSAALDDQDKLFTDQTRRRQSGRNRSFLRDA